MRHVLFICVHNSARSQMAEAYLNALGAGAFSAKSAGLSPGVLNPLAVVVMQEAGIDISSNAVKPVDAFLQTPFDFVITVCSESEAEGCPVFPGGGKKRAWHFPDPSKLEGTPEEKLQQTREIRDAIRDAVREFIRENPE